MSTSQRLLAAFWILAGANHFLIPKAYRAIVPDYLPAHRRLVVRLVRPDGEFAGILGLYVGGGLRGSVQAMLSRGDDRMFERMAVLTEPARRPAAILFCDLEDSGVHSRKLSW